jgi:hypothetical protein
MATPVHQKLRARPQTQDPGANVLTVSLVGIRRMIVILRVSDEVHGESNEVSWTLSAYATLVDSLLPDRNLKTVNLAPSLVTLPPLGARTMHVATLFWPPEPAAAALNVLFSNPGDIPQGQADAFGIGDTTPHDYAGLFMCPFGYAPPFGRLVEPFPNDPALLSRFEAEGRIPPTIDRRRL